MVKNEPVCLTRQTIYCIIPLLDIYTEKKSTVLPNDMEQEYFGKAL